MTKVKRLLNAVGVVIQEDHQHFPLRLTPKNRQCHMHQCNSQVHLNKFDYFVKVNSLQSFNLKSETFILKRFCTQSEIFKVFSSFNCDDYG